MTSKTFTRIELYDLVWSTPITILLQTYAVTYSVFRQICSDMNIPLPKSGHWQKIKHKKEVEKEPLSSENAGKEEIVLFLKTEGSQLNSNPLSPLLMRQREIESDPTLPLVVPKKLTNPCSLVIKARDKMMERGPNHFGIYKGLVSTRMDELDMLISPGNISRALRFMDTFIKLVQARGHKIIVENGTYIVIEDEKLGISLNEKKSRVLVKDKFSWQTAEYSPTGILAFKIRERAYRISEWKDGKLPIEKQLSKILAALELKVEEIKEENLRIEAYHERQRIVEEKERRVEERKEKELANFKELLESAKKWQEAQLIKNYVDHVERKNPSPDVQKWAKWARSKADLHVPKVSFKG